LGRNLKEKRNWKKGGDWGEECEKNELGDDEEKKPVEVVCNGPDTIKKHKLGLLERRKKEEREGATKKKAGTLRENPLLSRKRKCVPSECGRGIAVAKGTKEKGCKK